MQAPVPPTIEPPLSEMPPSGPYRFRGTGPTAHERLMMFVGAFIGLLVFVGFFAFHAAYLVPVPCVNCTPASPELAAYSSLVQALAWIAVGALDLAVGLSVALAFILGARSELPESTRRSVFLFATVFVTAWTVFSFILFAALASTIRYL